jgi:hypothetical protein
MSDEPTITIPGFLTGNESDPKLTACIICTGLLFALLYKKAVITGDEANTIFDNAVAIARGAQNDAGEAAVDRLIGSLEQGRDLFHFLTQPGVLP